MITPGQFFGTLQDAITIQWRNHLQTNKYSVHMALDEFYKEMPEKVDALIEAYQSSFDIVKDYANVIMGTNNDPLKYMEELKAFVFNNKSSIFDGISDLESLVDDILELIDSTLYKLKHLTESKHISLVDFIH